MLLHQLQQIRIQKHLLLLAAGETCEKSREEKKAVCSAHAFSFRHKPEFDKISSTV